MKYPEPGKVKTRLAKSVGDQRAAQAYRELTETNLGILNSLPQDFIKLIVAFDPPEKEEAFRSWLSGSYEYVVQRGSGLGVRLQNAFQFAFEKGFKKVMALGSDTLGLRADLIMKGFDALEFYDVVIGPAYDGGYYLIGTNCEQPSIFKNIPWSSQHVFESTLNKLNEKNLSYYLLQKLDDLDEVPVGQAADGRSVIWHRSVGSAKNLRGGKEHEIFT
ncbi:MAG: TIGR04282 family arsenosugar biosynthesis glycosyltransferase [Candidatus Omnitrophica bacterium]|nr:TIGR04282 family arsenosugar biosynthesis glycosyltransferase [Candidatus Omnitrophota bacterium]